MPEENYRWLPREQILSFDEIVRVVEVFAKMGATRVRLTGGEPLLRTDVVELVERIAKVPSLSDLAMTTNATLLSKNAQHLLKAGLKRLTVSLDTLRADRFERLTGRADLRKALDGLESAAAAGFVGTKINAVVINGFNDDELLELLAYAGSVGAELRFIEYMDVGGATRWEYERVVSRTTILERVEEKLGAVTPYATDEAAPARRYVTKTGQVFGIIASTTQPFCAHCDRSRITADGMWYHCLYAAKGFSLRDLLRSEPNNEVLAQTVQQHWQQRTDQGAKDRLVQQDRRPLVQLPVLQQNPHLEMHTRGG
jgi:cyclic pyranopterin phosphate synthase